jgi:hypothetical protein
MTVRWVVLLAIVVGCASGGRSGPGDGQHDAPPGTPIDGPPMADAKKSDAMTAADAPVDSAPGGGLDPDLELPDPGGQVCDEPGRIGSPECPAAEVCRFFTPTEGRCEGCTDCGNLGAACTATEQCDIVHVCYQGRCTNFCILDSLQCGAPADCIDIGHATRGVCKP